MGFGQEDGISDGSRDDRQIVHGIADVLGLPDASIAFKPELDRMLGGPIGEGELGRADVDLAR